MGHEAAVAVRARPKWPLLIGAVAMTAALAAMALLWSGRDSTQDALCRGLGSDVAGLGVITWDNGITSVGPAWLAALTDGVDHADPPSRRAITAAVTTDVSGYESMVKGLSPTDREHFDRLRLAVMNPDDPTSRPYDPQTSRALSTVRLLATTKCNII